MKILVVLGDGGHSTEMIELVKMLGPDYEYSYLILKTDLVSEGMIVYPGPIYRVNRPISKGQLDHGMWRAIFHRNFYKILQGIFQQCVVWLKVRPGVILSTGAVVAIPISVFGKFMGSKIIHVETGARVFELSLTGKWMYHFADLFFVQWEQLKEKYPRAIYAGRLM
jgi:UDP-N-acetylglucosamine:LPS N-acetylglucosamine transferase